MKAARKANAVRAGLENLHSQPMQIRREGAEAAHWLRRAISSYGSHSMVAPTSMAVAFGRIFGILRSTLDFGLLHQSSC